MDRYPKIEIHSDFDYGEHCFEISLPSAQSKNEVWGEFQQNLGEWWSEVQGTPYQYRPAPLLITKTGRSLFGQFFQFLIFDFSNSVFLDVLKLE